MRRTVAACAMVLALIAGAAADDRAGDPLFVDVTSQSGVDFVHVNGASGELLLPEVIGGGGALFDYDNDGDLDLFAVQGAPLDVLRDPRAAARAPKSRLFRNDSPRDSKGEIRFTDVTAESGIDVRGYGMGATTGDVDNDGWVDVYVTALGANHLLHNRGDGTFTDITAASRTDDLHWSTSATFFDYDGDGALDLYVANYVQFSPDMKRGCYSAASARDYCNPAVYPPAADRLFHNDRQGVFSDVTGRAGFDRAARGLGVLASDVNGDGWTDVYVANDGDPNQLWINDRGSGHFHDEALLAGVALSRAGQPQGSMGIDAADVDDDGDEDLFVTNLDNEANTFYRNVGGGLFEDRTSEIGLFRLGFTGFGTRFFDFDNDGLLDLVVANGAVRRAARGAGADVRDALRQRAQLFRGARQRPFVDATAAAGPAFAAMDVGRGVATGDLDNDGDVDLLLFSNGGRLRVLKNNEGSRRHWLGVRVVDGRYRRDAVNARVVLRRRGGAPLLRRVHVDGSYCAASDPRVLFGLGDDASAHDVRVEWPGGGVDEFRGLAANRYWILERGKPPRQQ